MAPANSPKKCSRHCMCDKGCILASLERDNRQHNNISTLIRIISIISLSHLHALQKLPLIFLFSSKLATVSLDSHDSSPPATSYINHFLSVSHCGHIAPCCISLIPISLSQQSIYCTGKTWRLDVNKVMSQCSACHDGRDNRLIRIFILMIQLKLGLWFIWHNHSQINISI